LIPLEGAIITPRTHHASCLFGKYKIIHGGVILSSFPSFPRKSLFKNPIFSFLKHFHIFFYFLSFFSYFSQSLSHFLIPFPTPRFLTKTINWANCSVSTCNINPFSPCTPPTNRTYSSPTTPPPPSSTPMSNSTSTAIPNNSSRPRAIWSGLRKSKLRRLRSRAFTFLADLEKIGKRRISFMFFWSVNTQIHFSLTPIKLIIFLN
jgi:hypothetical protein